MDISSRERHSDLVVGPVYRLGPSRAQWVLLAALVVLTLACVAVFLVTGR